MNDSTKYYGPMLRIRVYPIDLILPTKVVDQIGNGQQVERGEELAVGVATRVVVVAVDAKDGQIDGVKFVLIVRDVPASAAGSAEAAKVLGRVAEDLNLDGVGAHAVPPQNLHRFVQAEARRTVVVEQIARDQHHIALVLFRQVQDLLERGEGILVCV